MNQLFSFSELYDVVIRATQPTRVFGRDFEANEPIMVFERIDMAQILPVPQVMEARGGDGNRAHIIWEEMLEIQLGFSQGVFSMEQLSLIANSELNTSYVTEVSQLERLIPDDSSTITLKYVPSDTPFLYNSRGEKQEISFYGEQSLNVTNKNDYYIVHYKHEISAPGSISIGADSGLGFVSLEGKTRVKEEKDGLVRTGILFFPKLQLMSSLSIRLGKSAAPVIGTFSAKALPVGERRSQKFYDFILLDRDIDNQ